VGSTERKIAALDWWFLISVVYPGTRRCYASIVMLYLFIGMLFTVYNARIFYCIPGIW
jgi:hypothetical protein